MIWSWSPVRTRDAIKVARRVCCPSSSTVAWADSAVFTDQRRHSTCYDVQQPVYEREVLLTGRSAYDDYFKAYSVAVMDRKDRPELLYGGKSALSSYLPFFAHALINQSLCLRRLWPSYVSYLTQCAKAKLTGSCTGYRGTLDIPAS